MLAGCWVLLGAMLNPSVSIATTNGFDSIFGVVSCLLEVEAWLLLIFINFDWLLLARWLSLKSWNVFCHLVFSFFLLQFSTRTVQYF